MSVTFLTNEDKAGFDQDIARLSEEIARQPASKPRVYIDGVIPTTKDEVMAELTYEHGPERWHAYITIKCQGSSSMNYAKKNFTVKLYSDEARTVPFNVLFDIFGQPCNKFVLKANWVDHTHARNVIAARIWGEVVGSRADYNSLPKQLRNSPNNGAVNGFPIIVYTNGNYQGVYTWNIGKDAWMWGMDENDPNQALLCGEHNSLDTAESETATNFRRLWNGSEDYWKYEVGENHEGIVESFNRLIACIKDTSEVECKAQLDNYLDVQSAIDYDLVNCVFCGVDNSARNMLAQTYNLILWRLGMYDLDNTFGGGNGSIPADSAHLGAKYYEQNSLLWERVEKLYASRMKERGKELRKGVLSYANIMSHFEGFIGSIGKEAYEDDLIPYPGIPVGNVEPIWQFRNWVRERLAYFDSWLDGLVEYVLCTGVTLDKTTLTFSSGATQKLTATITPANCNDVVKWESSDPSIVTVENGVVTPVRNGEATITATCGGISAACPVTISGVDGNKTPLYSLPAPVTFGSTDDGIDTGVSLLDEDKSFTVLLEYTVDAPVKDANRFVFYNPAASNAVTSRGFGIAANGWNGDMLLYNFVDTSYNSKSFNNGYWSNRKGVVALRRAYGSNDIKVTAYDGFNTTEQTFTTMINDMIVPSAATTARLGVYVNFNNGSWIPSSYWPGSIKRAEIYGYCLPDDEVNAFIEGAK